MAKRLLAGEKYQTHPQSHHLWLMLPQRWTSDGFVAQARSRGVIVNASSEFAKVRTQSAASRERRPFMGSGERGR